MSNVYQLRFEIDPSKYSERYRRIGLAEDTIAALQRALHQAQAELRIAKREQRANRAVEESR